MLTPLSVVNWVQELPEWVKVTAPTAPPDRRLARLDPDDRDAIQLALEMQASMVLIDERMGRAEAPSRGLSIIGALGILLEGQRAGILEANVGFQRLPALEKFCMSLQLRQEFLASLKLPTGKD